MSQNGEINKRFGVYTSVCCGEEIILREGSAFPDCPNHPKLPTMWKSAIDSAIPKASELRTKKKGNDPAA